MTRTRIGRAVVAAVLSTGCLVGVGVVTQPTPARAAVSSLPPSAAELGGAMLVSPAVPVATQRQQFLASVDAARVGYGRAALVVSSEATSLAQRIAERSSAGLAASPVFPGSGEYEKGGCRNVVGYGATWADDAPELPGVDGAFGFERTRQHSDVWDLLARNTTATEVGVGVAVASYRRDLDQRVVQQITWVVVAGNCAVAPVTASDGSVSYDGIAVRGKILERYVGLEGSAGFLSAPMGVEFGPLRGGGAGQHFRNGSIYWSPATGAHPVSGQIAVEHARLGWENGWLGYPTTGEVRIRGGVLQRFQGGLVYWSSTTGAHAVRGAILDLYGRYGWEVGTLGFPTVTETPLRGGGAYSGFQNGNVYWTPRTGAHAVRGTVLSSYGGLGYEGGPLGYPTTEQRTLPFDASRGVTGAWAQDFERGTIEARTRL